MEPAIFDARPEEHDARVAHKFTSRLLPVRQPAVVSLVCVTILAASASGLGCSRTTPQQANSDRVNTATQLLTDLFDGVRPPLQQIGERHVAVCEDDIPYADIDDPYGRVRQPYAYPANPSEGLKQIKSVAQAEGWQHLQQGAFDTALYGTRDIDGTSYELTVAMAYAEPSADAALMVEFPGKDC
jgi:hypothetical protein